MQSNSGTLSKAQTTLQKPSSPINLLNTRTLAGLEVAKSACQMGHFVPSNFVQLQTKTCALSNNVLHMSYVTFTMLGPMATPHSQQAQSKIWSKPSLPFTLQGPLTPGNPPHAVSRESLLLCMGERCPKRHTSPQHLLSCRDGLGESTRLWSHI